MARAMAESLVPVFISTPTSRRDAKSLRLRRMPKRHHDFVRARCEDANVSATPGEAPDRDGENIIGVALLQYQSTWSPLLPMDDEKRAMSLFIFSPNRVSTRAQIVAVTLVNS